MRLRLNLSRIVRNPVRWAMSQLQGKRRGAEQAEEILEQIDDGADRAAQGAIEGAVRKGLGAHPPAVDGKDELP